MRGLILISKLMKRYNLSKYVTLWTTVFITTE